MSLEMDEVSTLLDKATIGDLIELALHRKGGELSIDTKPEAVFRREGETWVLQFAGKTVYAKDRIGLEYISYLLANPGSTAPVMSLYLAVTGGLNGFAATRRRSKHDAQHELNGWQISGAGTAEVLADPAALAECRQRLREIEAELAQAQAQNDEARALRLKEEQEGLLRYLNACNRLDGRLRKVADVREKVRKSVSNAISRAILVISDDHEVLGRHLSNSIKTGYKMVYNPETPVEWYL